MVDSLDRDAERQVAELAEDRKYRWPIHGSGQPRSMAVEWP